MERSQRDELFAKAREAVLAAFPDAQAIYVYGSFSRGEQWPDSDIDLAILREPGAAAWNPLEVGADLAASLQREVDLVDLRAASDVLRCAVLASGKLLYAKDPDALLAWEANALTRYGHYREEIRDLLADFDQDGIGYAP